MRYPGGKNSTFHKFINLMPPHGIYVEPFLGSGAVLRRKRPARLNVGIDLDAASISAVIAELGESRDRRPYIVENCEVGSGMSTLAVAGDGGPRFRFFCVDGLDWLERVSLPAQTLVYLDPPYLLDTRKSGKLYRFEFSDADHVRLLRLARGLRCMVMVSGYWSPVYARALAKWNSIHFPAMTRGGSVAEEWVWFNFPPPVELHDYRFLGETFRDRERLKRRITRWRSRLGRMEILERQALMGAIDAAWGRPGPIAGHGEDAGGLLMRPRAWRKGNKTRFPDRL